MKVLVVRFSSIGDILMTTPVLRCLQEQLPGLQLHYLTKRKFAFVLEGNPRVDRFHYLEDSFSDLIRQLKEERFNYLVDLHHNLRTFRLKRALGVPHSAYFKANIEKWLYIHWRINRLPGTHTSERFLQTLAPLGVRDDGKGLEYYFTHSWDLETLLPESHRDGYLACVIGGSYFTRRMPPEKIFAILRLVPGPVVLLGGPEDRERGSLIAGQLGSRAFNACGSLSFEASAFLVSRARAVMTHDTSLMHVAAAFNKKIVSVWGHNIPEFGNEAFRVDQSWKIGLELPCRPCSKNGSDRCPQGHFKCMKDIPETEVAALLRP